jgi:hypothetical protein
MGRKQVFHRCNPRFMLANNLRKSIKDDQEAAGKIFFLACANGAAGDKSESRPLLINNTVASDSGARINADNPYWLALLIMRPEFVYDNASIISSGISKLA